MILLCWEKEICRREKEEKNNAEIAADNPCFFSEFKFQLIQ